MTPFFERIKRAVAPTSSGAGLLQALAHTPLPAQQADELARYLVEAPDQALYRFNPAHAARELGWPRRTMLERAGQAMQAGVLDLNWEVGCPMCQGQQTAFASLSQAHSEFTCPMCSHHFHACFDAEIRVTFTINERFRSPGNVVDDLKWRQAIDAEIGPTSGHEVLTLQFFRDFFINEPLPEGESFQIRWLALLFTDLGGSTALYARQGDPRAYGLVREHFNLLFRTVADHGGAVVKTIGDAVMAVFPSGTMALEAAQAAQTALAAFNQQRSLEPEDRLALKIGIHAGPALAVTLNDRLDYFGTAVNAAARVQNEAQPNETLVTRPAFEDPTAPAWAVEPVWETLALRGLEQQAFEILRIPA